MKLVTLPTLPGLQEISELPMEFKILESTPTLDSGCHFLPLGHYFQELIPVRLFMAS
jgi:hypothetical protein